MQSFPKLCLAAYKINTFNNFNTRMSHSLCFIICDWLVWSHVSQGRHESGSISRFLLSVEERSQPCWGISFYIATCGVGSFVFHASTLHVTERVDQTGIRNLKRCDLTATQGELLLRKRFLFGTLNTKLIQPPGQLAERQKAISQ